MHATLVIMAAGLATRYGGGKQVDALGPNGEILMDYSIYDAVRAGFDKVVFIIQESMYETFHRSVGARVEKLVPAEYVFQRMDDVPAGTRAAEGRTKPLGTVHAMLAARNVIHEPFAIINADDYYGAAAFEIMYGALKDVDADTAAMVGYRLKNTVSDNGTVSRGVCAVKNGVLESVTETYEIGVCADGSIRDFHFHKEGDVLEPEALVSMNFWGFAPDVFAPAEAFFADFLRSLPADEMKKECALPTFIDAQLRSGGMKVNVLSCDASWFGVTYREDRPLVKKALEKLHAAGVYPKSLLTV